VEKAQPKAVGGEHYCFGCSLRNRYGLRLRFALDRAAGRARSVFRLPRRFEGPPDAAHGGVVAALLDEAMTKVNAARGVKALTAGLAVRYHRMVPLGRPVTVEAWHRRSRGREEHVAARIVDGEGRLLARGSARFVRVSGAWLDELRAAGRRRAAAVRRPRPRAGAASGRGGVSRPAETTRPAKTTRGTGGGKGRVRRGG